ncbi:hypothetical protein EG329_014256 [Mollisiaceae sp. DMI_Dod_QoI]|nr:hypothetical protein EG329_014256 [Helotiales sp. DMI_Dod_QoI]
MTMELQTQVDCLTNSLILIDLKSTDLGWTFDGTEHYYTIPFSRYSGLDTNHLIAVLFSSIPKPVTFGPIAYCGTGSAYPVPTTVAVIEPTFAISATTGPSAMAVDTFGNANTDNLGFWHRGGNATTYRERLQKS